MKTGGKYFPLYASLSHAGQDEISMRFAEIEAALKAPLPPSARASKGWWSNRKGAIQSSAWMSAGYHVAAVDLSQGRVTFRKPTPRYSVRQEGGRVVWDGGLVKALRQHMALNQANFAQELGVRQQTVSEWENGIYAPSRAMCKYLSLVAERAGFSYETDEAG